MFVIGLLTKCSLKCVLDVIGMCVIDFLYASLLWSLVIYHIKTQDCDLKRIMQWFIWRTKVIIVLKNDFLRKKINEITYNWYIFQIMKKDYLTKMMKKGKTKNIIIHWSGKTFLIAYLISFIFLWLLALFYTYFYVSI